MKDIVKSVSKLSIPISLNIASSIVRNKILSIVVGPIGLGVYSQFINLSGLAYSILPIGSLGLINYISKYHAENKNDEINYLLHYFFKRNFLVSIAASMFIFLTRDSISVWLFSGSDFSNLLTLFSIFIPFNLVLNFVDIYLKSVRQINTYVIFLSINSLVSLICTIPLIYFWGIEGALLALIFSVLLNLMTGYLILRRTKMIQNFRSTKVVENSVISNIYKVGIVSLVSMALQNTTFLFVRSLIADKLGLTDVGIFQCVYSLSAGYFGIFFTVMGNYSIPKISSLKDSTDIIDELNNTVKFLLLVYVPLISCMFTLRSIIIPLLYSGEFVASKELLIFQLPAELVRAFSWIMGLWLIPKLQIRKWIYFELIFYISFSLFSYILITFGGIGLKSISISYLVAYVLFFFINFIYARLNLKFTFSFYNIKFLMISSCCLICVFVVSGFFENAGYYVILPLLSVWFYLIFKKGDLKKLLEIFQSRFQTK